LHCVPLPCPLVAIAASVSIWDEYRWQSHYTYSFALFADLTMS
jgi:hypothetical protein